MPLAQLADPWQKLPVKKVESENGQQFIDESMCEEEDENNLCPATRQHRRNIAPSMLTVFHLRDSLVLCWRYHRRHTTHTGLVLSCHSPCGLCRVPANHLCAHPLLY
ncbi:hypothetical protein FKM82_008360 [Ascaphus truei]